MHENANTRDASGSDSRAAAAVLMWLAVIHACTLEIFLRKPGSSGHRYCLVARFLALFYIPLFTVMAAESLQAIVVMNVFWHLFIFMCVIDRLAGVRARNRGYCVHSHYIGVSWTSTRFEPVLCLLLCIAVLMFGKAGFVLAGYLVVGSFCLAFLDGWRTKRDRAGAQAMMDARWEQENLAQVYGQMKGGDDNR